MTPGALILALALSIPAQVATPSADGVPPADDERPVSERTLEAARAAIADLEYDQAALLLQDVVTDADASEPTLLLAHHYLGSVEVIRGRFAEARLHFRWILVRQPDFQLPPSEPPKVQGYFNDVREELVRDQAAPPSAPAVPDAEVDASEDEDDIPLWPIVAGGVVAGAVIVVAATAGAGAAVYLFSQPSLGTIDFR